MRRMLSQMLFIVLLLLGPITFATDSVPNFQPDCENVVFLVTKAIVKVAIIAPPPPAAKAQLKLLTEEISIKTVPSTDTHLFSPSCYSRPPPVIRS